MHTFNKYSQKSNFTECNVSYSFHAACPTSHRQLVHTFMMRFDLVIWIDLHNIYWECQAYITDNIKNVSRVCLYFIIWSLTQWISKKIFFSRFIILKNMEIVINQTVTYKEVYKTIHMKTPSWRMKMKRYGVNVRETALLPREKQSNLQLRILFDVFCFIRRKEKEKSK